MRSIGTGKGWRQGVGGGDGSEDCGNTVVTIKLLGAEPSYILSSAIGM